MRTFIEIGPYGAPQVNIDGADDEARWILIEDDPASTEMARRSVFPEHRERVTVLGGGFESALRSIARGSVDLVSMVNFLGGDGIYPPENPYKVDYEKLIGFCNYVLRSGGSVRIVEGRDYTPADFNFVREAFESGGFELRALARDGEGYTVTFNRHR